MFRSFLYQQMISRCRSAYINGHRNFDAKVDRFVYVTQDVKTGTTIMTLRRPPVNSLNLEMLEQVTAAIKELEMKDVKGFILTSALPKIFSAGLDINEMVDFESNRVHVYWKAFQDMWKTLYLTPLITVAAVNGHAPGAGCILPLSCDYRIMIDTKATIGITGTKLGISVPQWFKSLLVHNIGFRPAEKALFLSTLFSPQQAMDSMLVDELASSSEDLLQKSYRAMDVFKKIPESARRMTKIAMRNKLVEDLNAYGDQELEEFIEFLAQDQTQTMLKNHISDLKSKQKAT